jgi:hypothetical protein
LRLVYGATTDILYGEDANLNGVLDSNEPEDIQNGQLDPGILDYLTVYSKDSNLGINVTNKVVATSQTDLQTLLEQLLGASRANEIVTKLFPGGTGGGTAGGGAGGGGAGGGGAGGGGAGGGGAGGGGAAMPAFTSLLDFYIQAKTLAALTPEEFALFEGDITVAATNVVGLVNVNTASEAVLTCVTGIGTDYASAMVAFREANPARLDSIAWVSEVLPEANAIAAGPYLTARSYQWTADIAALGHHYRGFQRVKFVFDMSEGAPRIVFRQDLTHLGWALGQEVRRTIELEK